MVQPTFMVVVYEVDKAYGGPEEGGWWYNIGVPSTEPEALELMRVFHGDRDPAEAYRDELEETLEAINEEQRRPPPWSVACRGYFQAYIIDNGFPEPFPKEIPTYE